ncbi:MAG: hypothetical protein ACLUN0_02515 [Roseburia sp.]
MWAILMIVLFFSAFAGIIYLINRIGKFGFLNKITKGKKWLRILISAVLVCGITVILWVAWGFDECYSMHYASDYILAYQ